jgi:hypothetical protein
MRFIVLAAVLAAGLPRSSALEQRPVEVGLVRWGTDLDAALIASRASGRPVLVLFDEIPGCATVRRFGREVLAHPLVAEAMETLFHPVLVHNNRSGREAELLRAFGEPSWNNPMIRILDSDRRDLIPRQDGVYTVAGVVQTLAAALARAGRGVPLWLTLLEQEAAAPARSVFAVHCFWACEAALGDIDGVLATRAGFREGSEVVEVLQDPAHLDAATLERIARSRGCASGVLGDVAIRPAPQDTKYAIGRTAWRFVPLTEAQASRVNAAIASRGDPQKYVSPAQRRIFEAATRAPKRFPVALHAPDFRAAFARARTRAGL